MNNITYIYHLLPVQELISFLKIDNNILMGNFKRGNNFPYRTIKKVKPNGDYRNITAPHFDLKRIQKLILRSILENYPVHQSAYGIGKTKTIKYNALEHLKNHNKCLLNLDIQKFFPSITYLNVKQMYRELGFSRECSNLLTKLTTFDGSLPQGSPASPYISSIIFKELDDYIFQKTSERGLMYTRYVDDITISGNFKKSDVFLKKIKSKIKKSGYQLHGENKTELFFDNEDKIVNNIIILDQGIDVSEKYKQLLILDIGNFKNEEKDLRKIVGKINFCKYINENTGNHLEDLFNNKKNSLS